MKRFVILLDGFLRVACGLEFDDEPTGEAVDPSELGEGIVGDTNAGSSAPDVE